LEKSPSLDSTAAATGASAIAFDLLRSIHPSRTRTRAGQGENCERARASPPRDVQAPFTNLVPVVRSACWRCLRWDPPAF
jgi:hypothetical protein